MKKYFLYVVVLCFIAAIATFVFESQNPPECTYEYGINWNTLKFEKACKELKDKNTDLWQKEEDKILQAKKQQTIYKDSSDSIREVQDKVAMEINNVRKQDSYAFRKAE